MVFWSELFRNEVVNTFDSWDGDINTNFWLHWSVGFKLMSDTEDARFYYTLGIEAPTSLFTEGEILYFWLKYRDDAMTDEHAGAVSCKMVIGDAQSAQAD